MTKSEKSIREDFGHPQDKHYDDDDYLISTQPLFKKLFKCHGCGDILDLDECYYQCNRCERGFCCRRCALLKNKKYKDEKDMVAADFKDISDRATSDDSDDEYKPPQKNKSKSKQSKKSSSKKGNNNKSSSNNNKSSTNNNKSSSNNNKLSSKKRGRGRGKSRRKN